MKILVLFSGTKSIEKALDRLKNKDIEYRSLDIDSHFNPYYNEDILKWDYQKVLSSWIPDYIHASPICKEFTMIKNNPTFNRDLELGISLLKKSLEIIDFVKHINPNLKWTMENPKGLMRKLDIMRPYNVLLTSYCKYGFNYRKDTNFWFGGFDLVLYKPCRSKNYCKCIVKEGKKYYHPTEIAYKPRHNKSITDSMELSSLKSNGEYENYTSSYYLYRIPPKLCDSIIQQVTSSNLVKSTKK